MTERLLTLVLVVEAALAAVVLVSLAARVTVSSLRQRRDAGTLRLARELVRAAVIDGSSTGPAVRAFRDLPLRNRVAVLLELSAAVSGAGLVRLRYVADASGFLAQAHAWSRSRRWWLRMRGLRLLAQLGVAPVPPERFFDDPHPAIKAAAADDVVAPVQPEVVTRMLAMLEDPVALCRFSAKAGLFRLGRDAAAGLRRYLAVDHSVSALEAALEVAIALGDPAFTEPALRLCAASDPCVRRAATSLLARTGGDVAGPQLVRLLDDPDAAVRVAAAEGVGELCHWSAAPALAAALGDPTWAVRYAAAVALRRLGPPGALYLRRAAGSDDAAAADIAHQVLALPDGAMSMVSR